MNTLMAQTYPKAFLAGRTIVRALDLAIVLGGLLAAYGWFVDDAGVLRLGGGIAAGAFLAGLAFLAFTAVAIAILRLSAPARSSLPRHPYKD